MYLLKSAERWRQQPQYPVEPDWNNPLTVNLLHATACFGGALIDWTPSGPYENWTVVSAPTIKPRLISSVYRNGYGVELNGASFYYRVLPQAEIVTNVAPVSLAILGSFPSVVGFCGGWSSTGSTSVNMATLDWDSGISGWRSFFRASGGNFTSRTISGVVANEPSLLCFSIPGLTDTQNFVNGMDANGTLTSSAATGAPAWDTWCIGGLRRSTTNNPGPNGLKVWLQLGWRGLMSSSFQSELNRNPWQIFKRRKSRRYIL